MRTARHVRVTGRVQGVFFRAWTQEQAQSLGLGGWVRNCDDGAVEAHVEGDAANVDQMIERMREGPPGARVDELQSSVTATEASSGFEVRG